jgi:hypothetical protein
MSFAPPGAVGVEKYGFSLGHAKNATAIIAITIRIIPTTFLFTLP